MRALVAGAAALGMLLILPQVLLAHPGHPGHAAHPLAAQMQAALAAAPREVGGRCQQTDLVPGVGRACRTERGLFRVTLSNGSSFTTHGLDAPPPTSVSAFAPDSETAISSASKSDVRCVDSSTKRTTVIYAYPSNRSSRYATIAPLLRQETYKLSAFLGAESRAVDPAKTKRLQLRCDVSGEAEVLHVQLPTADTADSFSTIVDDLAGLGYGGSYSSLAKDRYLVYYDAPGNGGAAGTGHLYAHDVASASSSNNNGGLVAVEYYWGSGVPHWDVLLHEAGHNMGAVQFSAPHTTDTSTGGHCNDGQDIMCYSDGGPQSAYNGTVCAVEVFDCNRDDYFHPTPSSGSYLATHWNIAASYNSYITHESTDSDPPSAPPGVTVAAATNNVVKLTWGASSDNVGVSAYRVYLASGAGWQLLATTSDTSYVVSGLSGSTSYTFAIAAVDAVGNESAKSSTAAATTNAPDPEAPVFSGALSATGATMNSIGVSWPAATDNIQVTGYDVYRLVGSSWQLAGSLGPEARSYTFTGLVPTSLYSLGVVARDHSANGSARLQGTFSTAKDALAPKRPGRPYIRRKMSKAVKISWRASRDNVSVSRYFIYRSTDRRRWKLVAFTSPLQRTRVLRGLKRGRTYYFRVQAQDRVGNRSSYSPARKVRMPKAKRRYKRR